MVDIDKSVKLVKTIIKQNTPLQKIKSDLSAIFIQTKDCNEKVLIRLSAINSLMSLNINNPIELFTKVTEMLYNISSDDNSLAVLSNEYLESRSIDNPIHKILNDDYKLVDKLISISNYKTLLTSYLHYLTDKNFPVYSERYNNYSMIIAERIGLEDNNDSFYQRFKSIRASISSYSYDEINDFIQLFSMFIEGDFLLILDSEELLEYSSLTNQKKWEHYKFSLDQTVNIFSNVFNPDMISFIKQSRQIIKSDVRYYRKSYRNAIKYLVGSYPVKEEETKYLLNYYAFYYDCGDLVKVEHFNRKYKKVPVSDYILIKYKTDGEIYYSYDKKHHPVCDSLGVHAYSVTRGEDDYPSMVTNLSLSLDPCSNDLGVAYYKFDKFTDVREVTEYFYDINLNRITDLAFCRSITFGYREDFSFIRKAVGFLNPNDENLSDNFSRLIIERYDRFGNTILYRTIKSINDKKNDIDNIYKHYKYDSEGNHIITYNYNKKWKLSPLINPAIIINKYDKTGMLTETSTFNHKKKLIDNECGIAIIKYSYDKENDYYEKRYFNSKKKPVYAFKNGVLVKTKYDDLGREIEVRHYGKTGTLKTPASCFPLEKYVYDDNNNLIERRLYDKYENLSDEKLGYAIVRTKYDLENDIKELYFYNKEDNLCNNKCGFAKSIWTYDKEKDKEYGKFYDVNGGQINPEF